MKPIHPATNKLTLYTAAGLVMACALMQHAVLLWFIPIMKERNTQIWGVIDQSPLFPLVGWYVGCGTISLVVLLKERWLTNHLIRQIINSAICLLTLAWLVACIISMYQSLHPVVHIDYS